MCDFFVLSKVTSQEKEMTKRKQQEMKPQQVEIKSQQEMTTTKRVRIELDNVQNIGNLFLPDH